MSKEKDRNSKKAALEDLLSLKQMGPLYIDPKYLKPGYRYALPTNQPGQIDFYERLGYEVVKDDFEVGDRRASDSSPLGSAVTIQSKCSSLHVLMAISEEDFSLLEEAKRKRALELERSLGHLEGIDPRFTIGGVKMGNKPY